MSMFAKRFCFELEIQTQTDSKIEAGFYANFIRKPDTFDLRRMLITLSRELIHCCLCNINKTEVEPVKSYHSG